MSILNEASNLYGLRSTRSIAQLKDAIEFSYASINCVRQFNLRKSNVTKPHSVQDA